MDKLSPAAFQEACRAAGPLHLQIEGDGSCGERDIKVAQPFAILGKHPQATASWDDAELAPRHVYLQVIDGNVFCLDLETRTGTRWANASRSFGWIEPHAPLLIGARRIHIRPPSCVPQPSFNPLAPEPALEAGRSNLRLEILTGKEQPTFWTANRVLFLIGRSSLCKVRLHNLAISRFHAAVVCTAAGAWVVDLLSRTGLLLNGQKVTAARLDPGDQIQLGPFVIRVGLPSTAEQAGGALSLASRAENACGELLALAPFQANEPSQDIAQLSGSRALVHTLLLPLINQFNSMQQQMFEQFQQNLLMIFQMLQVTQKEQLGLVHQELDKIQKLSLQLSTLQAELVAQKMKQPVNGVQSLPGHNGAVRPQAGAAAAAQQAAAASHPEHKPGPEHKPVHDDIHRRLCEKVAVLQQERANSWQTIMSFVLGKY